MPNPVSASVSPNGTNTEFITDLGHQVRSEFDSIVHKCYDVSKALVDLCRKRGVPAELKEVKIGDKHVTHYVAIVPTRILSDATGDGYTIFDPTIQQFTLENWHAGRTEIALGRKRDLPEIGIYPPSSEERELWYHRK